jgi:DNA repair exonuclease SbcCD nuclease subunit
MIRLRRGLGLIRFIHTADWQIGKPYRSVQDDKNRYRLQHERIAAIERIGAVVRDQNAAFVVVAGDLFDSSTVAREAVLEVFEAIAALAVPVLVIPGNHDHGGAGGIWHREDVRRDQRTMAPNLRLLLERQPLVLDAAVLLPCPLLRNQDSSDPSQWLRQLDWTSLPSDRPRIVLAHGGVHGFGGRDFGDDDGAQAGANNLIDLDALPGAEIDYIALGDWHNLKQVSPRAWYCGTPEPDRFDQGADNQRGQVLVVCCQRGRLPEVEPVATGRCRWHNLAIHFHSDDDLPRFEQRLEALLGGRVARDVLRLEVSGSLSLAGHRRYEHLLEDLRGRLLRLRLKGECLPAPQAEELEALVARAEDPLIARVAAQLRQRVEADADPVATALARTALAELFRYATSA